MTRETPNICVYDVFEISDEFLACETCHLYVKVFNVFFLRFLNILYLPSSNLLSVLKQHKVLFLILDVIGGYMAMND